MERIMHVCVHLLKDRIKSYGSCQPHKDGFVTHIRIRRESTKRKFIKIYIECHIETIQSSLIKN